MRRIHIPAASLALLLATPAIFAEPASLTPVQPVVTLTDDQTAPPTVDDARRLQNAGKFAEAANAWAAIVKENPNSGPAVFNLGYCLHGAGRLDEAIEVHKMAAEFDDFKGIATYNLGCAFALQGNTDAAVDALMRAQEYGFDVGERLYTDDDLVSLRGDDRIAVLFSADSNDSGKSQRSDRWAKMAQAIAEQVGPKAKQAIAQAAPQALEQLSARYPDMAPVINNVGPMIVNRMNGGQHQHSDGGNHNGNGDVDEKVAEMQHELSTALNGIFMQGQQILRMVEQQLQYAIENDPRLQEALHGMAHDPRFDDMIMGVRQFSSRLQQGGGGQASAQSGGGDLDARLASAFEQAQAATQRGDADTAISIYSQILEHIPDNADATFMLGYTLHMEGRIEEAIPLHRAAAGYEQYAGIATYNLACAYALTGQTEKALEALAHARAKGFDVADTAPNDADFNSIKNHPRFKEITNARNLGREV